MSLAGDHRLNCPKRLDICVGVCDCGVDATLRIMQADPVNPAHYHSGGIEAIDVIEAFGLSFSLGNAVKYILRAGRKGDAKTDLRKAAWYLEREIEKAGK